ncbi:MFS general substrate transporter [Lepidopterella palustris CBS 459.81]|uniref:MFS general substrate transporter n=1 Tax=Lepidopterella palustris CBS 459.81 TaxID=1314670 RepID=A0A8E2EEN8_9PEZI|nr:MFS general substrate transporter [Lepidopterella palustris CBS 459.81]
MSTSSDTAIDLPSVATTGVSKRDRKLKCITELIDKNGFDWWVWAFACTGLFASSYGLFATNAISPALAFVYWNDDRFSSRETTINVITLTGSILGAVGFGYLGDRYSRVKSYQAALIIFILTTISICQCSEGVGGSLSIIDGLLAWRFFMGIATGAIYHLSAIITSEWAPVQSRSRMLAAVILMQPLAQLCIYIVSYCALAGLDRTYKLQRIDSKDYSVYRAMAAPIVDKYWRYVIGAGAIPALIPILLRCRITEAGRYTLQVNDKADQAIKDTNNHFGIVDFRSIQEGAELEDAIIGDNAPPKQFSIQDIKAVFITEKRWRYLFGLSLCCYITSFAYYGLGLNNQQTIAKLWTAQNKASIVDVPIWNPDNTQPDASIYEALKANLDRYMVVISICSIICGLVVVKWINYVPRRKMLAWSFIFVPAILGLTAISVLKNFHGIVLYCICQLVFNLGPNTLLFIMPAEVFPIRYRCVCCGICAASENFGALTSQALLGYLSIHGVSISHSETYVFGWSLVVLAAIMVLGALPAWGWIPDVQGIRTHGSYQISSLSLEDIEKRIHRNTVVLSSQVRGETGAQSRRVMSAPKTQLIPPGGEPNIRQDSSSVSQTLYEEEILGMREKAQARISSLHQQFKKD